MNNNKHSRHAAQAGFTLVELSIVLVIIGLIVGGVLAGQDMIRAAEIRATISQVEEFNTAANTFRDKYRAMPGDIGAALAQNFQLNDSANRAAAAQPPNQNGLLECRLAACDDGNATDPITRAFGGETAMFWVDLSAKNLIENSLSTATYAVTGGAAADITPGGTNDLFNYVPEAKMGKGNFLTVFSAAGKNFYQLTGIDAITTGTGAYDLNNSLTPQEAFNIDAKMDDGKPLTGTVRALTSAAATSLNNNTATFDPGIAGVAHDLGVCVELPNTAGATAPYDGVTSPNDNIADYNTLSDDESNAPACQLRLMFN